MKKFEVRALGLSELENTELLQNGGAFLPTVPLLPFLMYDLLEKMIEKMKDQE